MIIKRSDDPAPRPAEKRKRGGQANNKNAYKHGFYAKYFTDFENKVLSEISLTDVTDVIDLMRVSTGRFLEAYTASLEELDYEDKHAAFRSIGLAAGVIASLIRVQASASKNAKEAKEITEALEKLGEDSDREEMQSLE